MAEAPLAGAAPVALVAAPVALAGGQKEAAQAADRPAEGPAPSSCFNCPARSSGMAGEQFGNCLQTPPKLQTLCVAYLRPVL
jgi:hypothetical protein